VIGGGGGGGDDDDGSILRQLQVVSKLSYENGNLFATKCVL